MNFSTHQLPEVLLRRIGALGWKETTPPQDQILTSIANGDLFLLEGHKGWGKRSAALLGVAARLCAGGSDGPLEPNRRPRAVILTGTDTEAVAAGELFDSITEGTHLSSLVFGEGGDLERAQRSTLGVDLIIGRAGVLDWAFDRFKLNFEDVEVVGVFSAEGVFDTGGDFQRLEKILDRIPRAAEERMFFIADKVLQRYELCAKSYFAELEIFRFYARYKAPRLLERFDLIGRKERIATVCGLVAKMPPDVRVLVLTSRNSIKKTVDALAAAGRPAVAVRKRYTAAVVEQQMELMGTRCAVADTDQAPKIFPKGSFDALILCELPEDAGDYEAAVSLAWLNPTKERPWCGFAVSLCMPEQYKQWSSLRAQLRPTMWKILDFTHGLAKPAPTALESPRAFERRCVMAMSRIRRGLGLPPLFPRRKRRRRPGEAAGSGQPVGEPTSVSLKTPWTLLQEAAQVADDFIESDARTGADRGAGYDIESPVWEAVLNSDGLVLEVDSALEACAAASTGSARIRSASERAAPAAVEAPADAVCAEAGEEPAQKAFEEAADAAEDAGRKAGEEAADEADGSAEAVAGSEADNASAAPCEESADTAEDAGRKAAEEAAEESGADAEGVEDFGGAAEDASEDEEVFEDDDGSDVDEHDELPEEESFDDDAEWEDAGEDEEFEEDDLEDDGEYVDEEETYGRGLGEEGGETDEAAGDAGEEAPHRRTLTIRSGYVPREEKDEPVVTITEPLSSNTVELRAAQERMRREMKGGERLTHQMVGRRGTIRRPKRRAGEAMPAEQEGILAAQPAGRRGEKDGERRRQKKNFQKGAKPRQRQKQQRAREKDLQPAFLAEDYSAEALTVPGEGSRPAVQEERRPKPAQKQARKQRDAQKKGGTLRTPFNKRRKQRQDAAEVPADARAAAPVSASVQAPAPVEAPRAPEGAAEKQAIKPAAGDAIPGAEARPAGGKQKRRRDQQNPQGQQKGRRLRDKDRRARKNGGEAPFERGFGAEGGADDNFGNSIHYRPKRAAAAAMPWQTADAYAADRPQTLSFAQTMPGEAGFDAPRTIFGSSQPDNKVKPSGGRKFQKFRKPGGRGGNDRGGAPRGRSKPLKKPRGE